MRILQEVYKCEFCNKKMKKTLFIAAVIICSNVFSQQINYTISRNQPVFPKYSLNLDLLNMDANFNNSDNLSFNAGLWGYANILGGLEAQFNIQKSYAQLARLVNKNYVGNIEASVGAAYFLKQLDRTENVRVVLSEKTSYDGRYTLTKYLMIPGTVSYKFGVQGGAYYRLSPYEFEVQYDSKDLNMTNIGLYAGGVIKRSTSLIINYNGDNTAMYSGNWDFFADAMILPVSSFKDTQTQSAISASDKELIKQSPLGFRAGCRLYQADKRENTGKRFGVCYTGTFGKKPYQGWFLSASIGITLLKK